MKIEDEFFNFIRKFQKIGEIEEGTILMGVKCLDSEGCLDDPGWRVQRRQPVWLSVWVCRRVEHDLSAVEELDLRLQFGYPGRSGQEGQEGAGIHALHGPGAASRAGVWQGGLPDFHHVPRDRTGRATGRVS